MTPVHEGMDNCALGKPFDSSASLMKLPSLDLVLISNCWCKTGSEGGDVVHLVDALLFLISNV